MTPYCAILRQTKQRVDKAKSVYVNNHLIIKNSKQNNYGFVYQITSTGAAHFQHMSNRFTRCFWVHGINLQCICNCTHPFNENKQLHMIFVAAWQQFCLRMSLKIYRNQFTVWYTYLYTQNQISLNSTAKSFQCVIYKTRLHIRQTNTQKKILF